MKTHHKKNLVAFLAVPILSGTLLYAEPPQPDGGPGRPPIPCGMPPGGPGGGPGAEHGGFGKGPHGLLDQLQLTEEQKAKVKEIFDANKSKFDALRGEEEEKMRELQAAVDSQIRPLLTKEQQVVFDDMAALRKAQETLRKDAEALKKGN